MKHIAVAGLCLSLAACGPVSTTRTSEPAQTQPAESVELTVFAASSLTDALDEIAAQFEAAHPGVKVVPNYGSSSQLATQINEGAPADVFASANTKQMQVVADAGHIQGEPRVFVTNRLVLIVPADNPGNVQSLSDLAQPGLKLILAAPGVPVRDYVDQMVQEKLIPDAAYGQAFADAFYQNVVSEEDNVRQVSTKIALGEADAGIVYTSDVTPDIQSQVKQIEIPDEYNILAAYPIAPIKESKHAAMAQAFIDFVLSENGQAILTKWGFGPAG